MFIKEIVINQNDAYTKLYKDMGSIFNEPAWTLVADENFKTYGIFDNSENLIGAFNIFNKKKLGFSFYRTNPFHPTNALFFKNESKNKAKKQTQEKKILKLLADFVEQKKPDIVSLYFPQQYTDMQVFIWKGYKVIPNYTYNIDLTKSLDLIQKDFSPERRNDITKAIKENIVCERTEDYKLVKDLVINTFERKQKDLNIAIVEKILFQFANPENSFAFISYRNEIPISAVFCIYDKFKAYYLLGGYHAELKHQGAGALAVWEAIKHAKSLQLPVFDFEGSMLPEVEKYFRAFGGDLVPYYSINKAKLPFEFILKIIKRSHF
jgi:lipid II:glycine glycyltransferase (peptidoglycan interpeptide bridge formation enzyme)